MEAATDPPLYPLEAWGVGMTEPRRTEDRERAISGDEQDWVSLGWRRVLCYLTRPGRGKQVKRAMNRRSRQRHKQEMHDDIQ